MGIELDWNGLNRTWSFGAPISILFIRKVGYGGCAGERSLADGRGRDRGSGGGSGSSQLGNIILALHLRNTRLEREFTLDRDPIQSMLITDSMGIETTVHRRRKRQLQIAVMSSTCKELYLPSRNMYEKFSCLRNPWQ